MNSLIPVIVSFVCLLLGYRFYSKYLAQKIFCLDDSSPTPAVTMEDGLDYVPTHKAIVFNHHFASIAGLSPMLGPALAVIWGWFPVIAWLIIGSILMGAVHDLAALVLSIRNQGRSVGEVANNLLGKRARILFLLIIFFAVALAMGTFAKVIASLLQFEAEGFQTYPAASFPAAMLMVIAMVFGVLLRKKKVGLLMVSIMGTALTFLCIWLGTKFTIPLTYTPLIYLLLIYSFAASVLPVWLLLQPRDFINAFTLYIGMFVMYIAIFVFQPTITAPAINTTSQNLPHMIPLLFVVVACGAISGFHSVVASGTTAKQLAKESDARAVGYGAMLAEGALGVVAVIACTAAFSSSEEWFTHYASWNAASGLGATLSVFVHGGGTFISWLGVPYHISSTFVALVVVSFALTTLDSGTRILRYNIEELGNALHIPIIKNRFLSTSIAIVAIWYLATSSMGKSLWVLFGTTNQLLAGLVLLTATVYLVMNKKPTYVTAVPMVIMLVLTIWALSKNLIQYIAEGHRELIVVGSAILLLAIGLIVEVILFFIRHRSGGTPTAETSEKSTHPVIP
jgi:carbon starvation protein